MKKIVLLILIVSTQVSADTVIDSTYYSNKVVHWNKAGSPYIITGPVTFSSSTLNIVDAKVIIRSGAISLSHNSVLNIQDASIENETNSYAISSFNSSVIMRSVVLDSPKIVEAYSGTISIDELTSSNSSTKTLFSIYSNANFSLTNSHIEKYKGNVVNLYGANNTEIKNNEFISNTQVITLYTSNSIKVNNNDFEQNTVAVESYVPGGDFEGNYLEKEKPTIYSFKEDASVEDWNILAGPFSIQRFSKQKNVKKIEPCCSNVLFLPGVMGSRLYMSGLTENQLWEPNRNTDVKKLYLDEFGKSINNIFTKDIIAKTNILGGLPRVDKDIYKDFISYLDKLKSKNTIQEYQAVPYDWRMSADYILDEGVRLKDKNIDLVQVVKDLQKTSKTGRVTLIAHSNGGLVLKQLILELQKVGLADKIDKIIFVAVPEYGTPQAITALMFGHNQSLAGGLIMRSSIARELAKNMPTAYTLLPSEKYYTYSPDSDRLLQETEIRNYSRVNIDLWEKSKQLHRQIDNIEYSKDTNIYQILGIGIPTLSDISLDEKNIYKMIPLYSKNGDGVVQDLRASRQGTVMYVDLSNTSYKHANIMNADSVIQHINNIINPPRIDIPEVGLDYNKIIKNNRYKLLQISPSNPNNKLSQYLTPFDMELSIGMSRIKDNIANELYFDRYSSNTTNNFRQVLEHLNKNRFEEFDDGVNYLYTDTMENFSLTPKVNTVLDISILENIDGEISSVEYQSIPVFKNSEMRFEVNNDSNTLNMTLPMTGQVIEFSIKTNSPEFTREERIDQVISGIRSSKMEWYLKERYVRRIEVYRKNNDLKYLETVKGRVAGAIDSIGSLAYSSTLRSRYAKAREDYIYLSMLLLKL